MRRGFEVESKPNSSPVTEADRAAELIILAALARAAPGVPVIAEEEVAAGRIPAHDDLYFLVDPLDGTKEFVRGGDEYTVNIGLIEGGSPRLGVVYAPAIRRLHGGVIGEGAWLDEGRGRESIRTRTEDLRSLQLRPGLTSTRRRSIISRRQSAPVLICRSARRLNSVSSRKAKPTFTRVRRRPASGTQPRATRSCSQLGDWSTVRTARRSVTGSAPFSIAPSSRPAAGKRRGSTPFLEPFSGGGDLPEGV